MQENITTYSKLVALKKKFFPGQLLPDRIARVLDGFFNNLHNFFIITYNKPLIKAKDNNGDLITPISICTFAMNRLHHVKLFVPHLLEVMEPYDELVFVDYSDPEESGKWVLSLKDKRVKVIKVDDMKWWHSSHARNIAIKNTANNIVCIVDVDVMLSKEALLGFRKIKEGQFITLNDFQDEHNRGTCCFLKKDFIKINGYEETFVNWGIEDTFLYKIFCNNAIKENGVALPFNVLKDSQIRNVEVCDRRFDYKINEEIFVSLLKRNPKKANVGRNWGIGGRVLR